MASDRMLQAIGTLDRAVDRLEQDVARLAVVTPSASRPGLNLPAARAALHSLDALIADLTVKPRG